MKKRYFDYLCGALRLNPGRDVISFVGGGGKTSTIVRMARELSNYKKKIILTSTTRLENIDFKMVRIHRQLERSNVDKIESLLENEPVFCAKRRVRGGKVKGIHPRIVSQINREVNFNYMLVEADGAGKKSLKAHNKYEPQVPMCTTLFIPVVGLDIVGKKLNLSNVHRPRMVCRVLNKSLGDTIEPEDLINILKNPGGLLKARPPATRTAVILNKVNDELMDTATEIAGKILKSVPDVSSVLCGQMQARQQLFLFA